jgi:hypothetical protein
MYNLNYNSFIKYEYADKAKFSAVSSSSSYYYYYYYYYYYPYDSKLQLSGLESRE